MPRIVIAGGGISGLTLAFRLQQGRPDLEVVVLEQGRRVGGTIDTACDEGFRVEAGPNGFLDSKPATYALCRELGLEDRLVAASAAASRNRYLLLGCRLQRLPTTLSSFVASEVLSWGGKAALLLERFRPPRRGGGDESVHAFVCRRAGREVAATLADALVTGIYAGDPRLLSVGACFPRLVALEREHGSVLRGLARTRPAGSSSGRLWSFPEGLKLLTDTLRDRLRRPPVNGVRVAAVRSLGRGSWQVEAIGGDFWSADTVALCCPAYEQAAILRGVDVELAGEVAAIPYNGVAVVALGFRAIDVPHRLDGFGYISPRRPGRDVLGVQWCSSIFPDRAPPGRVLLRAMCGGWDRPDVLGWDDDRLVAAVRKELARVLHVSATPVFRHIVRWEKAIPQYHVGHQGRVERIEALAARHPGLHLGGNAYHGVALNDCVEQADILAGRILATS
jgi:oxygen-dependent protoporphyrinogen oxidase